MVELLLRISLMTMWLVIVAFLQLFRSFDVAAGVVVIFFLLLLSFFFKCSDQKPTRKFFGRNLSWPSATLHDSGPERDSQRQSVTVCALVCACAHACFCMCVCSCECFLYSCSIFILACRPDRMSILHYTTVTCFIKTLSI